MKILLPIIIGVLLQNYLHISAFAFEFLCLGLLLVALSYFLHPRLHYRFRWLFGLGLFLSLLSLSVISTAYRQNQSAFIYPNAEQKYYGTVVDILKDKEKSLTCEIILKNSNKKIVTYIQKGVRSGWLKVGDEIEFNAKVNRIKHFGNPFDFDYPSYMYYKGFSGSVYLYSDDWEATGETVSSLPIKASHCRQAILNAYHSFDLNETEFALLSALTLGDKNALSDDLKNIFRVTGTAHILAVSGLHVGVICSVIISLFSLFCFRVRFNRAIQILIIIFLWVYAFITGLPPSVIRASVMLTIFCLANIFNRKGLTYNNIAIAACGMLIYNPFYLFDIGFQLSFSAVLAICFLHPLLRKTVSLKNKYIRKVWDLFSLSLAAQAGTFPICLYYFGMFPTYFFVTNLLIVPLVSLIVYAALLLLFCRLSVLVFPENIVSYICAIPLYLIKGLVWIMTTIASFFANLPFASITDIQISSFSVFMTLIIIILSILYVFYKEVKVLYTICFTILLGSIVYVIPPKNSLSIYQENGKSKIVWNVGHSTFWQDSFSGYRFIKIENKTCLSLTADYWANKQCIYRLPIDYLHIVKGDSLSLKSLARNFSFKRVILDASLSAKNKRRLKKECENLLLPYYDISEKGLFSTNF